MNPALLAQLPHPAWCAPFVLLLLLIAILPILPATRHWWEHNRNKLLLALLLSTATLYHYYTRNFGAQLHASAVGTALRLGGLEVHESGAPGHTHAVTGTGTSALAGMLGNVVMEYVPFIILLFTLYCISGGIAIGGDLQATPKTNTMFLAAGGLLASVIGTTGASMLLIRPLLQTNSERRHTVHTFIFFIFIVSNIGGTLLPIGDPPLFLGYLRGVPFDWTLCLWKPWAVMLVTLLVIYFAWDRIAFSREAKIDLVRDKLAVRLLTVRGGVNILWLVAAVAAVALLDPTQMVPGTNYRPPVFMREAIMLMLVAGSFITTPAGLRASQGFNFHAIAEVAALFIGVFITMQVPMEILHQQGAKLGLTQPWHFFWATGLLSSVLDNAPTYVVFFETANAMTTGPGPGVFTLLDGNYIRQDLLVAISLGAVFMGALTYIGNGPNFMVKAIAEQHGIRMPSFFKYLVYSGLVLLPLFVVLTFLFMR